VGLFLFPGHHTGNSSVSQVLNSVRKEGFLVASLTSFAQRQFLERIVTTDEIWVHHYEPESKAQSMAWKRPTSPVAKKFRNQPSAGKIMRPLFWDMEGVILIRFTPKDANLAPSDFHMFGPMKEALRGRKFSSDEVIGALQNCLKMQPETFFSDEIKKKLVRRWNRCIEAEGDYVDK
jgi:hypothetical protein